MDGEVDNVTSDDSRELFRPFEGFQTQALAAAEDELLWGGAKGGGKSQLLVAKMLYWIHRPLFKGLILRETFPELKQILAYAFRLYTALPGSMRATWRSGDKTFVWPNGASVELGHCERIEHVQRYQGREWAVIGYDEIGNQPDENVMNGLVAELRCKDPEIVRQFIGTANPGYAGHPWIMRRWIRPCGKFGERVHWDRQDFEDGSHEWITRRFIPGKVTDNPIYANDRKYMARLYALPDRLRRCLLHGDWDAALGVAFDEIEPSVHIVKPFKIPSHWPYVAGFDWGFIHNAVMCHGRVSPDGRIYIVDTIKRRLLRDWDLAGAFVELMPVGARTGIRAGWDAFNERNAGVSKGPTTASTFAAQGLHLVKASDERSQGYRNCLSYLAWKPSQYVPERQPLCLFFDTPGNRWLVEEQLTSLIVDPDDPRDVKKVDADPETGDGGDDGYDALRNLLAAKMIVAKSGYEEVDMDAFDPLVLEAEAARAMKGAVRPPQRGSRARRPYWAG